MIANIPSGIRFAIIHELVSCEENVLKVSTLCEIACVSRSGYYNWLANESARLIREDRDKKDFELILEAYRYRGYAKGGRSIYMRLLHRDPPVVMNLKKIRRLMKKFKLQCPIRRANPYRRMAKAMRTSHVAPNLLERRFRDFGMRKVLLTDITYIIYGGGLRCYLSVILDAYTKEVLAYVLSDSLAVDFVLETVNILIHDHGTSLYKAETLLNSDQGTHYTSVKFIMLIRDHKLRQSMSRRANCWDNAPQESFFGHMKDEIDIRHCQSFKDVKAIIDDWMDYYNNDRCQWDLAKLTPREFAEYTRTGIYPLIGLVGEPAPAH
jgi:transposase InsO family protein